MEFLGAAGTVTGSKFLVEVAGRRLLVDCGLYQGLKELRQRNWAPLPVEPARIDWVVLSHAHIDHTGYLPRLCKDGFRGPVYATRATADLARIMLPDSGHLQEEEAEYHNKRGTSRHDPALPLYTAEEGLAAAVRVSGVAYDKPLELAPGLRVSFARAGHIVGSATVTLTLGSGADRRRLLFSGDLGRRDAPILPDSTPVGSADYVVVESTYGDRLHGPEPIADQLERAIRGAAERGGAIVVPAFAVGRTQELLYHLSALSRAGRIRSLPTYLDSPMAIDATAIYWTHPEEFDDEMRRLVFRGDSPFRYGDLHLTRTPEESRAINAIAGPVLVISASGMATGGRVLHHLRQRLPDPAPPCCSSATRRKGPAAGSSRTAPGRCGSSGRRSPCGPASRRSTGCRLTPMPTGSWPGSGPRPRRRAGSSWCTASRPRPPPSPSGSAVSWAGRWRSRATGTGCRSSDGRDPPRRPARC